MTRHKHRAAGAASLALSVVFTLGAVLSVRADAAVVAYAAEGRAAAMHVRATKEDVLPVPNVFDSFLPYSRARATSPVSRLAVAAPAYDQNISNLPEFLCLASQAQFCPPSLPLRAQIEQPGADSDSDETQIPPVEAGPFRLAAGHARVHADESGAQASATDGGIVLASGTGGASAVSILTAALRSAAPGWSPASAHSDAIIAVGTNTSSVEVEIGGDQVTTVGTGEAGDVALLQGLIRIGSVRTELVVRSGSEPDVEGGPTLTQVTVGPFDAVVDHEGVRVVDQDAAPGAVEGVNAALAQIDPLVRIRAGQVETELRTGGVKAAATALHLSFRRETVPNTGAEEAEIALGRVSVEAARTSGELADTGTTEISASTDLSQRAPTRIDDPFVAAPQIPDSTDRGSGSLATLDEPQPGSLQPAGSFSLPEFPGRLYVLIGLAVVSGALGIVLLAGWQVATEADAPVPHRRERP